MQMLNTYFAILVKVDLKLFPIATDFSAKIL